MINETNKNEIFSNLSDNKDIIDSGIDIDSYDQSSCSFSPSDILQPLNNENRNRDNTSFLLNSAPPAFIHDHAYRAQASTFLRNQLNKSYTTTTTTTTNNNINNDITNRSIGIVQATMNNNNDKMYTLDSAFRSVKRACEAEDQGRYQEALKYYMDGGETLYSGAENEKNDKIKDLLFHKAFEVLNWAESLASWMETDQMIPLRKRKAQTVAIEINNNNNNKVNENELYDFNRKSFDHYKSNELKKDKTNIMHYTPVITCNPSNFTKDGYTLQCLQEGRHPSLMVVITMYNEDPNELNATLRKVGNNVEYLKSQYLPGYEGDDAWQNILICIVSDGREKANKKTLEYLKTLGLYDEDVINISSTGVHVEMHMFERTVYNLHKELKNNTISNHTTNNIIKTFPPLQIVFGLKEKNAGKLNSHLWYFNAFVAQICPEYTCLLDVGTMPTKSAFYRLLSAMEINLQIGGVCGEIAVDKPIPNLFNFIISAQHYEYKISNILDKSMESCFGYISVLPGAFSAYRYKAIEGEPLNAYFKSLTTSMIELGPFQGNMYLAEDRILAFEILAKKNCNWTMHYVKNAIARTDVPINLTSLIAQRRRWLNGSFFASLFGIMQWYRVYTESGHSYFRKFFFTIQYIYICINTLFNFFLPSAFYLAIYYVVIAGFADNNWGFISTKDISYLYKDLFSALFNTTYGIAIISQIILGMGNKPKHVHYLYILTCIYFGFIMFMAFIIAILIFVLSNELKLFEIFFATAILGVYFIVGIIHFEIHHICMSFIQYIIMLPTFINILMTYSFCNLHDLSWGTKGIDTNNHHNDTNSQNTSNNNNNIKGTYQDIINKQKIENDKKLIKEKELDVLKKKFDSFRSYLLLIWILCNSSFVGLCIYFVQPNKFLPILYISVGAFNIFRLFGSIAYLIYYLRQYLLFSCFQYTGILKKRHNKNQLEKKIKERYTLNNKYDINKEMDLNNLTPNNKVPFIHIHSKSNIDHISPAAI